MFRLERIGTISYAELPLVSPVPALTDEAPLDAALEHVLATIPLKTRGSYSPHWPCVELHSLSYSLS
jgi:hypothetical protein